MELVDIPVADIKVLNRLRKTDAHKIQELTMINAKSDSHMKNDNADRTK